MHVLQNFKAPLLKDTSRVGKHESFGRAALAAFHVLPLSKESDVAKSEVEYPLRPRPAKGLDKTKIQNESAAWLMAVLCIPNGQMMLAPGTGGRTPPRTTYRRQHNHCHGGRENRAERGGARRQEFWDSAVEDSRSS